ncbi:MAG: FAD-dependent oxidoreductase [Verrucomicrobiae bacterium]|nr:FAD-dependent oxidoreductase [Verrucomicrobiae bacterium]
MPAEGMQAGICGELVERLKKLRAVKPSWFYKKFYKTPSCFDAEISKCVIQALCEEAGVEILYNTVLADVVMKNGGVSGVVVANKGGLSMIEARVVVDATGDGDVAFFAGAEFEKGNATGRCQPTNLMFNLGGLKKTKLSAAQVGMFARRVKEAIGKGQLHLPKHMQSENIGYWTRFIGEGSTIREDETTINIDMTSGIDGTDPEALSRAEVEGRRIALELLEFFRKNVPGARHAYLAKTASLYGVRETRRIKGQHDLTREEVLAGRKFEDGICKASFNIDIHGENEKKAKKEKWELTRCVPFGDWHEIPYRCLVPRKVDRLLVAGRCISADRSAQGSLRIQPTCMGTGQAAGVAAALAVKRNLKVRNVDGAEVRSILRKKLNVDI